MIRDFLGAVALLSAVLCSSAKAEEISLAIKNGETIELARPIWISDCKTLLNATPTAEILYGPPNLTISITSGDVVPWVAKCLSKKVPGGILSLTAKDVTEVKNAQLIVRIKYDTQDGPRVRSYSYDVVMVP